GPGAVGPVAPPRVEQGQRRGAAFARAPPSVYNKGPPTGPLVRADGRGGPRMLLPLLVATAVLVGSVMPFGLAIHLIVFVVMRIVQRGPGPPGYWKTSAVMAIVTLIVAAAHLALVTVWAVAFLLCGEFSTFETAFYFSAENYTALGYGDLQLSPRWRLLGPLEAVNGLLYFGLSTAVLFAILNQMITTRVSGGTGHRGEGAMSGAPFLAREPLSGDRPSGAEHGP